MPLALSGKRGMEWDASQEEIWVSEEEEEGGDGGGMNGQVEVRVHETRRVWRDEGHDDQYVCGPLTGAGGKGISR